MSTFTDYKGKASTEYDKTRKPIGIEIFQATLSQYCTTKFENQRVLALGAGTGTYEIELLKNGCGSMVVTDPSEVMLAQCESKLVSAGFSNKISFNQSSLPKIPFEDASFDSATSNMVMQHIVQTDASTGLNGAIPIVTDWSNISNTMKEVYRVLKPGGVFVVGYSTHEQRSANWYAKLIPDENRRKIVARFPSRERLLKCVEGSGLQLATEYAILQGMQGYQLYNDPNFVDHPGFWFTDSVLSGCPKDGIDSAKAKVKMLKSQWKLADWIKENDDVPRIGCGTIVVLKKPNCAICNDYVKKSLQL